MITGYQACSWCLGSGHHICVVGIRTNGSGLGAAN